MEKNRRDALHSLLASLGVIKGDMLMVHSAFSSVKQAIANDAETFIEAIIEYLGSEGTLVMPSFNFGLLHKGAEIIFNIKEAPSEMGFLTEVFRTRQGTLRSKNLFNPIIASGRLAEEISSCPNSTSWSYDSPFPIFYRENAAILMLGVDYNSMTMLHHAEQKFNVPYRFKHTFTNAYIIDVDGVKKPVEQSTFRKHPGYEQDLNLAEDVLEKKSLVSRGAFGDAVVRMVRAKSLTDVVMAEFTKNPYLLIQQGIQKKLVTTRVSEAFSPMDLINELWLQNRALVSDGFDNALKRISDFVPLKIHTFPSDKPAFDWTIPKNWENNGGGIYDPKGQLLFNLGDHPLNIAAGSVPFSGTLDKQDLMKKIFVHPDNPEAIPYKSCYYNNDWKICLSSKDLEKLNGDTFRVEINTKLTPGELKVGEVTLPGTIDERIVFPIHVDHPGQCNDNLSGVAVAVELIRQLSSRPRHHTMTFLFLPESIGSYAYLSSHEDLIPSFKYGITFDSIGAGESLFFMRTVQGDTELDVCARHALKKLEKGFREYGFLELEGYGNDERAFQSHGIGVPSVSLSRHPYNEYHSSLDTPYIISPHLLRETREVLLDLVEMVDKNFIPKLLFKGVPQFSKRNLWIDFADDPKKNIAMELFMYFADGETSIARLAERTSVSFDFAWDLFDKMANQGLVAKLSV